MPLGAAGLVRVAGLEPATSRFQTENSTKLSYTLEIGAGHHSGIKVPTRTTAIARSI